MFGKSPKESKAGRDEGLRERLRGAQLRKDEHKASGGTYGGRSFFCFLCLFSFFFFPPPPKQTSHRKTPGKPRNTQEKNKYIKRAPAGGIEPNRAVKLRHKISPRNIQTEHGRKINIVLISASAPALLYARVIACARTRAPARVFRFAIVVYIKKYFFICSFCLFCIII